MMLETINIHAIVADIGGTYARFSTVNLENLFIDKIEIYSCIDYHNFESVLEEYVVKHHLQHICHVAVAIACPVLDDVITMTNAHWNFSISEIKKKFCLLEFKVLNDFNAIAMSLPVLTNDELRSIGSGVGDSHKARVVLGAGTGLGVAYLLSDTFIHTAHAGEGGHISWGAKNEQEWFILNFLKRTYPHVSYERLLSGHGLENLYQALSAYKKVSVSALSTAHIVKAALENECEIAKASVLQFLTVLGSYAGDLALIFAAFGGVYIAGGIVPRLLSIIEQSEFRSSFESKGRFSKFNAQIPTYVITAKQPGILGAAVFLKQSLFHPVLAT